MSYRHVLNQCNDVFTDNKNSSAKLWLTGIYTADTLLRYLSKQHDSYMADCKIKPNTLHKKTAETLMVID